VNNDFTTYFWMIGRTILEGGNPYSIDGNVYPPITCMLFTIFAFLPQQLSLVVWLTINVLVFILMVIKKKNGIKSIIWLGYTPLLFTFIAGQLDFFLFWLSSFLEEDKWYTPILAALVTIKPQLAAIALPWILLVWFHHNKKLFIKTVVYCFILHGIPLMLDMELYNGWWMSLKSRAGIYQGASPGLFSLTGFGLSPYIIIPLATVIFIFGIASSKNVSIQANLLALPFGTWYNSVFLLGTAPWQLMVPFSWLSSILAYWVKGVYPFALIPLAAFIWSIWKNFSAKGFRFSSHKSGSLFH